MRQIGNQISKSAGHQLDELTEHFESQRVALEIAINDAHQRYCCYQWDPYFGPTPTLRPIHINEPSNRMGLPIRHRHIYYNWRWPEGGGRAWYSVGKGINKSVSMGDLSPERAKELANIKNNLYYLRG
jgi:hypothetical protein